MQHESDGLDPELFSLYYNLHDLVIPPLPRSRSRACSAHLAYSYSSVPSLPCCNSDSSYATTLVEHFLSMIGILIVYAPHSPPLVRDLYYRPLYLYVVQSKNIQKYYKSVHLS